MRYRPAALADLSQGSRLQNDLRFRADGNLHFEEQATALPPPGAADLAENATVARRCCFDLGNRLGHDANAAPGLTIHVDPDTRETTIEPRFRVTQHEMILRFVGIGI